MSRQPIDRKAFVAPMPVIMRALGLEVVGQPSGELVDDDEPRERGVRESDRAA